jgi:hypothetical protein
MNAAIALQACVEQTVRLMWTLVSPSRKPSDAGNQFVRLPCKLASQEMPAERGCRWRNTRLLRKCFADCPRYGVFRFAASRRAP